MVPAFALAIALNVLQPADTPLARPAPPPVSEVAPVTVPPATPTALRYYTSGNRLWVLDQAVSMAGNSGKVRLLIVWNIDFTNYDSDPMAGYAIIRPGGGCPACEALGR